MNRYVIKTNGASSFPNGVCQPKSAADWRGGELRCAITPARTKEGEKQDAPPISEGDELWLWAHESKEYGGGLGITAKATAGAQRVDGNRLYISLREIDVFKRPFGFGDLGQEPSGSRLFDFLKQYRHQTTYLIEDGDYPDFIRLVETRASALPDEMRFPDETEWSREIREHKGEILEGLAERRQNSQKTRPVQSQFRADLIEIYGGRCVLSGCAVPEALEAAHVLPHNGDPVRDRPDNGLLLRRDLHSMFDAMLWSIDPDTSKVRLSRRVQDSSYSALDGKVIDHKVAPEPLRVHFKQFQKADKGG